MKVVHRIGVEHLIRAGDRGFQQTAATGTPWSENATLTSLAGDGMSASTRKCKVVSALSR